jgi:hypothetical protein
MDAASRDRYRGPDLRQVQPPDFPRALPVAGGVLVVTVVAVAAVPGGVPVAELRMLLPGAAVVGGLVLVIQGVLLWHGSGRATPLWLSAGALAHIVWTHAG